MLLGDHCEDHLEHLSVKIYRIVSSHSTQQLHPALTYLYHQIVGTTVPRCQRL